MISSCPSSATKHFFSLKYTKVPLVVETHKTSRLHNKTSEPPNTIHWSIQPLNNRYHLKDIPKDVLYKESPLYQSVAVAQY